MYEIEIPLIRGFNLICLREDTVFNRLNPIELERGRNKVRRYKIISEQRKKVVIYNLVWEKQNLFDGIAIMHLNEILQSFLYGNLEQNKKYIVYSKNFHNGLFIELICNKGVYLKIECKNDTHDLCRIGKFNKAECRLLSKLLNYYLNKFELKEDMFDGHIICSFGNEKFALGKD